MRGLREQRGEESGEEEQQGEDARRGLQVVEAPGYGLGELGAGLLGGEEGCEGEHPEG